LSVMDNVVTKNDEFAGNLLNDAVRFESCADPDAPEKELYKKIRVTLMCLRKMEEQKRVEMMMKRIREDLPMVTIMLQMFCMRTSTATSLDAIEGDMERGVLNEGRYLDLCNRLRDAHEINDWIKSVGRMVYFSKAELDALMSDE